MIDDNEIKIKGQGSNRNGLLKVDICVIFIMLMNAINLIYKAHFFTSHNIIERNKRTFKIYKLKSNIYKYINISTLGEKIREINAFSGET